MSYFTSYVGPFTAFGTGSQSLGAPGFAVQGGLGADSGRLPGESDDDYLARMGYGPGSATGSGSSGASPSVNQDYQDKFDIVTKFSPLQYSAYQSSPYPATAKGARDFAAANSIRIRPDLNAKYSGGGDSSSGGFFNWVQGLFGSSKPAPQPGNTGFQAESFASSSGGPSTGTVLLVGAAAVAGIWYFGGKKGRRYMNPMVRPVRSACRFANGIGRKVTQPVRGFLKKVGV